VKKKEPALRLEDSQDANQGEYQNDQQADSGPDSDSHEGSHALQDFDRRTTVLDRLPM